MAVSSMGFSRFVSHDGESTSYYPPGTRFRLNDHVLSIESLSVTFKETGNDAMFADCAICCHVDSERIAREATVPAFLIGGSVYIDLRPIGINDLIAISCQTT